MPEGTEEVTTTQPEAEETAAEAVTESVDTDTAGSDDDREPGGDDGKAVYQRKMHRRAVQAEREAQELRQRIARYEGELEALKRQPQPTEQKKEPTIAEVTQAMEKGEISVAVGSAYIAKKRAEELHRETLDREAQEKPAKTALQQIQEYKQLVPGLADRSHQKFGDVRTEYERLTGELGLPASYQTELLALEHVFGKVDRLKAKQTMDKTDREGARFHAERGGGGTKVEAKDDWTSASKDQIALWDRLGTSAADRAKEWPYIQARAARKGGRAA